MRNLVFIFAVLLVITQGLLIYHNSSYVKGEYDRSCDQIYNEQVWLDMCHLPYSTQVKSLETFRNIEIVGLVISTAYLLYRSGFSIKRLRKI